MTDKTIDLDQHRGMAAQKATELPLALGGCRGERKDIAPSAGRTGIALAGGARGKLA